MLDPYQIPGFRDISSRTANKPEACFNRTLLTGIIDTSPRESKFIKDLFVFRLRMVNGMETDGSEGQDTLVHVCVTRDLFEKEKFGMGDQVAVEGEFRSYYKRLALYRPIIHVYATGLVRVQDEKLINWVCFEGSVMKEIVVITNLSGERSATCLCLTKDSAGGFAELPCVIKIEKEGQIDQIQKGDRYRMNGRITSRFYKKRLGRNKFEDELMNELTITQMTKVLVKSPNDNAVCT